MLSGVENVNGFIRRAWFEALLIIALLQYNIFVKGQVREELPGTVGPIGGGRWSIQYTDRL